MFDSENTNMLRNKFSPFAEPIYKKVFLEIDRQICPARPNTKYL